MSDARILALVLLFLAAVGLQGQTASPEPPKTSASPASSPTEARGAQRAAGESRPATPGAGAEKLEPQEPAQPATSEPQQPRTEILDTSSTAGALSSDGHDPILDPPPYPTGITTLAGGVISGLDRIRNRITLDVFGGGHWTILFDERTHIFRDGAEVTQLALKKGDRIYVDTMLDNNKRDVLARNIRVAVTTSPADTEGQIIYIDAKHSEIVVRDTVNSGSVHFRVDNATRISRGPAAASFGDLRPGSLVKIKFAADRADRGLARDIAIVAWPGSSFVFAGPITFLDTHRGVLAVRNAQDGKTYDLHFSLERTPNVRNLAVGAEVNIVATFDSTEYTAKQITVTRTARDAGK